MSEYYGLIPAAGNAIRMRPFRYPKELLPIYYQTDKGEVFVLPKLLIEHSLEALQKAGVKNTYVVVPDWKPEIMRYLEDGSQFGHSLSYLYNSKALGLADALFSAQSWLKDKITCFAMPDTIFSPNNAFEMLLTNMNNNQADLVLGVFPTSEPEHFATVEFDEYMTVIGVEDKPNKPKSKNIWGIAVWTPKFWDYFAVEINNLKDGQSISYIFDNAAKSGLKVKCVCFNDGWYRDVGRISNVSMI